MQAVDHYIPEVAELRKLVDFIPQWRVDDVMVSYAVDGGSVGPHYDNYDVFLLQGEGERLWKLGQFCDDDSALLPHDELRILEPVREPAGVFAEPGRHALRAARYRALGHRPGRMHHLFHRLSGTACQ